MAAYIFMQAISNGKEISLFNDGDMLRDFTYVDDTVMGFIKAAQTNVGLGEVFNLGTGEEIRIGDLAEMIIRLAGRNVKIETEPERMRPARSEVMRLISDNRWAREELGWMPSFSLEEGLELTIAWIKDHLDHYNVGKYEF